MYWEEIFVKLLYDKNRSGSGRGRISGSLLSGLGKGYSLGRDQLLTEENTLENGYGEGSSNDDQLIWNLQDAHPRIYGYGGDHVLSLGGWI